MRLCCKGRLSISSSPTHPTTCRSQAMSPAFHTQHREFAMGTGEMTKEGFTAFLQETLGHAAQACKDGAIAFVCMDWRHMGELLKAGQAVFSELKNLCVWNKNNGGMGSFYRHQVEFVHVFKHGRAPHVNTIELGRHGRYRTTLWTYAGVNTFRAGRMDELAMHPTVKPVALVADAIKDCTRRGDLVLDPFSGSGTTLMAAEKTGRRGRAIEVDPAYVDVAVRRWQQVTGRDAVLADQGQSFAERELEQQGAGGTASRLEPQSKVAEVSHG